MSLAKRCVKLFFIAVLISLIAGSPESVSGVAVRSSIPLHPLLQQRTNVPSYINATSMNSTDAVSAKPLRMKVTLPWWVSIIGGGFSFLIAFKAVTWDWDRRDYNASPWNLSISPIFTAFGLLFTFIQNLALLTNITLNYHNLGMVTPVTGNAYIVLFACSATLWTARVMDFAFPLIVGWINALMAITNFVLLSLPAVGTKGLYEAYSPHCMVLLDFKSADACNGTATVELRRAFQGTFTCANGTSLGFGETNPTWLPIYVDWAYALLIVLLLFSTLRRQVLSRMEKTYQPVGFAGTSLKSLSSSFPPHPDFKTKPSQAKQCVG